MAAVGEVDRAEDQAGSGVTGREHRRTYRILRELSSVLRKQNWWLAERSTRARPACRSLRVAVHWHYRLGDGSAVGRTKNEVLTIRTTADVKALLKLAAARERRSAASMVEVLVLEYARSNGLAVPSPRRFDQRGAKKGK